MKSMESGEASIRLTRAAINTGQFPGDVPDTPANRELFGKIMADIAANAGGRHPGRAERLQHDRRHPEGQVIHDLAGHGLAGRHAASGRAMAGQVRGHARGLAARDDDHFWELLNVRADPDIVKVGPKGYIHGWIFVGAPGVGAEVFHPHHGKGVVTGHDGKHATVKFASGKTQSFEAREGKGKGKLVERAKQPTGGSTEGTRGATRERMEREKQTTREQRAKWDAHNANRVVTNYHEIKNLNDEDLKGVDQELTRRATAIGRPGEVGKVHQKVKDELARRGGVNKPGGGKTPGVDQEKSKEYEAARDAATRYDATEPPTAGSALRTYEDPEKQKEAIRLHTAARRLAPDAKSKKYHTDQINRYKGHLAQIEHNRQLRDFKKEDEDTRAKIKELTTRNIGSDPEVYDQLAAAHSHMADVQEKHGAHLKANGYGGYAAYENAAKKHRDMAEAAREHAADVRERQAKNAERLKDQLPGAEAKVKEWEATARRTGKQNDVIRAAGGHREIAMHARAAGMYDLAKEHDDAARALDVDHLEGRLKPAGKPRSGGKPTLGALEADAKAKEAAAVQSKDPADMRTAATAWRTHAAATKNPGTKELSTNRADAIDRMATNRENEMRMDDVVKDPSSVKDLGDAHLTQVNHDLNSRELAPGSKSTEGHAEASAAVKAELARRKLPVEQASDRLGPTARSSQYPETVPKMTDAELAQADKEHADLTRRAGGGNAVIGEGHQAVRAEIARRQEAIANRPENRRKAYEDARARAKQAEFGTSGLDRTGASHDRAAAAHDRAAAAAVTDKQRALHEAKAKAFREQAENLRSGKDVETGGRKQTPDELSKKAKRTGTPQDHLAAFRAQQAAGNRSKADEHRKALEQLDNADEAEDDAQIHADAAAHTHDPDAHKAAADAYDEAADHLDGVSGARKREAALRAKAQGHRDEAADIEKKTAAYVQAFTTANRATRAADKSGKASAHREAAAAQRKAAARAMTVPQRRHHEAEAARHERAAQRAS